MATGGLPLKLAAAIAGLTLIRAVVAAGTGLTDDEAYYRLWALAPALSYLDHPPMVGWMIAAGRFIAGDNPLGVRLLAVVTSLLGPLVLLRTATLLFDRDLAERAVWLALAMPLLAVGGIVITPDTPSVLFWGLAAWALAELHVSRNANWWLAVGVFAGLGLLSKYTNLFVGAGIVLWLALLPANWRWLRCWQLWAGGLLAGVVALPVVVWNIDHDWASFAKQFGRVAQDGGVTLRYVLELAGAYLGLASPVIAVLAVVGLVAAVRAAIAGASPTSAMLVAGIIPLFCYFLVHALRDRVQPNWLAPLYPALAICAALALARAPGRPTADRLGRWALLVGFALSAVLYLHTLRPLLLQPYSKDPTAQMRGWPELAAEIDRLRVANGAQWIATSSYATTGQLAFAFKAGPPVLQLNDRLRYVHLPPPDGSLLKTPAIYVELERREMPALLRARFGSVTALGVIQRRHRGTALANYAVYRIADPLGPALQP